MIVFFQKPKRQTNVLHKYTKLEWNQKKGMMMMIMYKRRRTTCKYECVDFYFWWHGVVCKNTACGRQKKWQQQQQQRQQWYQYSVYYSKYMKRDEFCFSFNSLYFIIFFSLLIFRLVVLNYLNVYLFLSFFVIFSSFIVVVVGFFSVISKNGAQDKKKRFNEL